MSSLQAISPIDGRYKHLTKELSQFFSEEALIVYRLIVELDYLDVFTQSLDPNTHYQIGRCIESFKQDILDKSSNSAKLQEITQQIKQIERTTNHDVKAVEYYLHNWLDLNSLSHYIPLVHFGLTSQDINQTAQAMILYDACQFCLVPELNHKLLVYLAQLAQSWANQPMLSRTHGQPASPTTVGKEMVVFHARLLPMVQKLGKFVFLGKMGGAVGNFNAHRVAFEALSDDRQIDPQALVDEVYSKYVTNDIGENREMITRNPITTQIEPYDNLAEFCYLLIRINTVLIDLCRDIWQYISLGYFKLKVVKGEVGSSTMPHKVNPIDFENAEGNLGLANCLLNHLAQKLPISRLQRDLTDSTVCRNLGTIFGHCLVAYQKLFKGLGKLALDTDKLMADLDDHWEVLAEAIQSILRLHGHPRAYEALKDLTRTGQRVTQQSLHQFIDSLEIKEHLKTYMKGLTPHNYIGLAPKLVEKYFAQLYK